MAIIYERLRSKNSSDQDKCHHLADYSWQLSYLTDTIFKILVTAIFFHCLAAILTILLDALVIFAMATKRRLQTKSNILLAFLAGTDLLTGLVVHPCGIAVNVKRAFGIGPFCTLETAYVVLFVGQGFVTLTHLVLIRIDRYISIKDPLRYQEIVTTRRIRRAVFLAWIISTLFIFQDIILATVHVGTKIYALFWTLVTFETGCFLFDLYYFHLLL